MKVLVAGSDHATIVASVLSREGHVVTTCEKPTNLQLISQIQVEHPDVVVAADRIRLESIRFLEKQRIPLVGDSLWAGALDSSDYQDKLLSVLASDGISVVGGVTPDFYVEGWWDSLSFTFAFCGINKTHFMHEDHGPHVESAIAFGFPLRLNSKLAVATLDTIKCYLKKVSYIGPIQISLRFISERPVICGITAGFKYDLGLAATEVSLVYLPFFLGKAPRARSACFGSVHISLSPFPISLLGSSELQNCTPEALKHMAVGKGSNLGFLSARGVDVQEVRRRICRTLSRLGPSTLQYRTDFGREFSDLQRTLSRFSLL